MSFGDVLSRISQLDSLLHSVDPGWTSRVPPRSALPGLITEGSPFSGILQTEASAATLDPATSGSAVRPSVITAGRTARAALAQLKPSVVDVGPGATLLAPSATDLGSMVEASGSSVLARFDAVAPGIPYAAQIRSAAISAGIDPLLLTGLVYAESNFHPDARSRAGALGLTQLMPGTARGLGVTDITDPQQNLNGGATYIARQMRRFGRVDLALAAYNAGPGAIARLGVVPASKQGYVRKILRKWSSFQGQ